jgi:hypothetical protein
MMSSDLAHIVLCLCEEVNTPRSLAIYMMVDAGEVDQLLLLSVDPARYTDPLLYFRDALATELLRKAKGLTDGKRLRDSAVKSFFESETVCYRANERLTPFLFGDCVDGNSERIMEVFSMARKYISFILGACPSPPPGRFGPGATFADRGVFSTVPDKMSSSPTLTDAACSFIPSWSRTAWARGVSAHLGKIELVRGNRFTTVPKDSKKDRGIAVEPSINVFYQLAYGGEIRRRLRRVNVDLDSRQEVHRRLALQGSVDGGFCTIDLSSASDTVCSNLVKLLLPPRWHEVLASLRSPFTVLDGKWVKLEKFSSMGNGFTFELETLLFQSLAFAVMALGGHLPDERSNLFVFGDDIIVPSGSASDVIGILSFCGLSVNKSKTFVSGGFRESCGGDFFNGRAVRPFYLKEVPDEPHKWIAFANGLRRVVRDSGFDLSLHRTRRLILNQLPSVIRGLRGPESLGDGVIHDHESRWCGATLEKRGRRRIELGAYDPRLGDGIRYFKCWLPVNHKTVGWSNFRSDVVLATALYGTGDGLMGVTPRDSVTGYGLRWVPSS